MWSVLALSSIGVASAAAANATMLCAKLLASPCNDAGIKQFPSAYTATQTDCEGYIAGMGWLDGDDTETTGNTIGCRLHYANLATVADPNPCRYAGMTGGGVCGPFLANVCKSLKTSCGAITGTAFVDEAACMDGTTGLGAMAPFWGSKQGPAAADENSLECRVYHALVGWNLGATGLEGHCNHTFLTPAVGWCMGAITPSASHYCTTAMTSCPAPNAQYASMGDCMAVWNTFPDANVTTTNANTRGCRQYHIQAAGAGAGLIHCTHGGPTGNGQCGTIEAAWASIANNSACYTANYSWVGASVAGAIANFAMADLITIVPEGTANYSITVTSGDTQQCRIYHGSVAAGGTAGHCDHPAIPSVACVDAGVTPGLAPVCRMIWAGCGNASGYTDVAGCLSTLTPFLPAKAGAATDNNGMPNTDTIACRGFQAAMAVAAKKMSQSTATACANVKAVAGPLCGGAGASPTPAKSAAPVALFSASLALPLLFL